MTAAGLSSSRGAAASRSQAPARPLPSWAGTIGRAVCLILLTGLCYLPALRGSFLWDDNVLVTANPLLRSVGGLHDIWWSTRPYDYFPLTLTSFWLEWPLWGDHPLGYHLTNLLLHLVSAMLFWRIMRALRLPGAWFGALLFALHPVNVASVAWIAERKNALSMVFYLACLLAWLRAENALPADRTRWRWYGAALAFYVLAALSKSSVVMLPFVLWLLAWWRRGQVGWGDVARSAPFFAISLAVGLVSIWFQQHRSMTPGYLLEARPFWWRVLQSAHAILFYLSKGLLPLRLSMLYPAWPVTAASPSAYLPLLGLLGLLGTAWIGQARWGRGPAAVLGYFGLMLLPVAGLFHMAFFEYSEVSDHFVYLALAGLLAGVAALLGRWYEQGGFQARAALAFMTLLAGWLCLACWQRADDFSSAERLWRSTLEVAPDSFAAHDNLGSVLVQEHKLSLAEWHFRAALRLQPRSFNVNNNLADLLRQEGRWAESAALYQAVLRAQPDAGVYNNLGVDLLETGDTRQARAQFQRALALEPAFAMAHFNLYRAALADRNYAAAAAELRACLRLQSDDVEAMEALVALSVESEPGVSAPGSPTPGAVLSLAKRMCEVSRYQDATALGLLAKAYLANGQRDDAARIAHRGLVVADQAGQADIHAEIARFLQSSL